MGPQNLHTYSQHLSITLVIRKIAYQTILYGFNTLFNTDKNTIFPPYPLNIGMNSLAIANVLKYFKGMTQKKRWKIIEIYLSMHGPFLMKNGKRKRS